MKSSMFGHRLRLAVLPAATVALVASATARAEDTAAAPKKSDMDAAVQTTIFRGDAVSNLYDDVQQWKKDEGVPIEIGAWHWWHMHRNTDRDLMYGNRGMEGTYYYYLRFDPETDNGAGTKIGAHLDVRARDGEESFRPHFESNLWLWEAYAYIDACDTKFKAGKIWRRFGLDWDGSFFGNVAYFDGWKLDPDWGASVERTCDFGRGITAPSFLQVFFAEDRVNGAFSSIGTTTPDDSDPATGADPEADERAREKLSFIARTVPTWTMKDGCAIALGLSAQAGKISNRDRSDHWSTAGAIDVTWTKGAAKLFAEYIKEIGERHPVHYVTGGSTTRAEIMEIGGAYKYRFATFRASVSHGNYHHPGGTQLLYLVGVDMAVTKNVDFIVEWVRWDTRQQNGAPRSFVEDGIQLVLNWRF